MKTKESNKRKQKGIIVTVTSHVIVIILFCLFGFNVIEPKEDIALDWAIEGVENAGGETEDESTAEDVSDKVNDSSSASSDASSNQDQEIITDEGSEIEVKSTPIKDPVKKAKETTITETKKDNPEETVEPKKEGPSSDLQNLFNHTAKVKGKPKNGDSGLGDGNNSGTEGQKNGGGTQKTGDGRSVGNGSRWAVGNRKPISVKEISHACNATGKIKVYITIDKNGKVTSAQDRGGTSQDPCLIKAAIQQAKGIKYGAGSTKNEGTITIDLSL